MPSQLAPNSIETPRFGGSFLSPGMYKLNDKLMQSIPMRINGQTSTFWEVYVTLLNAKIKEISILGDRYETESGFILLDGKDEQPLKPAMKVLAEVLKAGGNPYTASWFYFGKDHSIDADEIQKFFVVYENKILGTFSFDRRDPNILIKPEDKDDHIWASHRYFEQASEIYWYRKFYTETMIGQLMVLRPDEPPIYFYERPMSFDTEVAGKDKPKSKWREALRIAGLFISGCLVTLYTAFAVSALWNWFIATPLHTAEVTLWQGLGIIFLAGLFKYQLGDAEDYKKWQTLLLTVAACVPQSKERQLKEQLEDAPGHFTMLFMRAAGVSSALILGWFFHSL